MIVAFDKTPVDDYHHVQRLVAESPVGKTVTLEILRKKQKMDVPITVAEVPDPNRRSPTRSVPGQPARRVQPLAGAGAGSLRAAPAAPRAIPRVAAAGATSDGPPALG